MRHINIPVFIPHLGCPNQCVFCNQKSISGVKEFDPDSLTEIIESALSTVNDGDEVEIAFFGGSFTGIDRSLMISLLERAHKYIELGKVKAIRCSTRPDYIDEETLDILERFGVRTIELGLQSVSDEVLKISKRGHNFEAELKACQLIVERGFDLVGQMMIGLPGSTIEDEIRTAEFIVKMGAVGARIYPTVVFKDTELCSMTECGFYTPLELSDAVSRSAKVLEILTSGGVKVIRIGLQASENLSDESCYLAGPNHSALGEMVIGETYYNKICKILSEKNLTGEENITVLVPKGAMSKAVGQNKKNKIRLTEMFGKISFKESDNLSEYSLSVEINNGEIKCT